MALYYMDGHRVPRFGLAIYCVGSHSGRVDELGSLMLGWLRAVAVVIGDAPLLILVLRAYARPNTTPRIKKEKYTLCAEWTMIPIQVLRKRQLGNAYRKTPLTTDARMPQGWWAW
jgi:hypothetical protein